MTRCGSCAAVPVVDGSTVLPGTKNGYLGVVQLTVPLGGSMKDAKETKMIKRYQNRKLYDTHESSYVTLDEIAKMIRGGEDLKVIDNKTKNDITAATLTQLLYESERKSKNQSPIELLKDIIRHGDGSFSGYIHAKLSNEMAKFESEPKTAQPSAPELSVFNQ